MLVTDSQCSAQLKTNPVSKYIRQWIRYCSTSSCEIGERKCQIGSAKWGSFETRLRLVFKGSLLRR